MSPSLSFASSLLSSVMFFLTVVDFSVCCIFVGVWGVVVFGWVSVGLWWYVCVQRRGKSPLINTILDVQKRSFSRGGAKSNDGIFNELAESILAKIHGEKYTHKPFIKTYRHDTTKHFVSLCIFVCVRVRVRVCVCVCV